MAKRLASHFATGKYMGRSQTPNPEITESYGAQKRHRWFITCFLPGFSFGLSYLKEDKNGRFHLHIMPSSSTSLPLPGFKNRAKERGKMQWAQNHQSSERKFEKWEKFHFERLEKNNRDQGIRESPSSIEDPIWKIMKKRKYAIFSRFPEFHSSGKYLTSFSPPRSFSLPINNTFLRPFYFLLAVLNRRKENRKRTETWRINSHCAKMSEMISGIFETFDQ